MAFIRKNNSHIIFLSWLQGAGCLRERMRDLRIREAKVRTNFAKRCAHEREVEAARVQEETQLRREQAKADANVAGAGKGKGKPNAKGKGKGTAKGYGGGKNSKGKGRGKK